MRRIKVLAVFGVAALILGACGNDTDSAGGADLDADEQAYVDEMTAAFEEDAAGDESFPADQIECWIGDMTDGIGVDKLKEAGFTPEGLGGDSDGTDMEKLSEGDRKVVADSFTECVDLKEIIVGSMEAEAGGEELPKEMKECFDGIDWDTMEGAFAEDIVSGNDEMESAAMAPLMGCMMMGLGDMMGDDMGDDMGDFDMEDFDMDELEAPTTVG